MNSCLLVASPSWYCSRVSDCSEEGYLVFGAKNTLYSLDVNQKDPSFTDQLVVHQERVVSLALCHISGHTNKCATTSEDGKVRLWDLHTKNLIGEHAEHQVLGYHFANRQKVPAGLTEQLPLLSFYIKIFVIKLCYLHSRDSQLLFIGHRWIQI